MTSFDPREMMKPKVDVIEKLPLVRFEPTLRRSINTIIPMTLDRLEKHRVNIEKYVQFKSWQDQTREEINATRTVQQLKATLRDIDNIKDQIRDEDLEKYQKMVLPTKEQVLTGIQDYMSLNEKIHSGLGENRADQSMQFASYEYGIDHQLQTDKESLKTQDLAAASKSWDQLHNGLVELHELMTDFSAVVQQQQEAVDNIEDNIESAQEDVHHGTKHLAQASKYKIAMIPVAGAIVGGIIGGPIGLLAGFKLAGVAAAGVGGFVGYQGGKYVKQKHSDKVDMELENLSTVERTNKEVKKDR